MGTCTVAQMPLPFPYGSDGDSTPRGVGFRLSPHLIVVGVVMCTSTVAQMPLPFAYGSDGDSTPRGVGFRLSPHSVMDSGDGASHSMTIYEGYALLNAILRLIWLAMIFQSF